MKDKTTEKIKTVRVETDINLKKIAFFNIVILPAKFYLITLRNNLRRGLF